MALISSTLISYHIFVCVFIFVSVIVEILKFEFIQFLFYSKCFFYKTFRRINKMSFLFHPLKITDVISFAWSVLKSLTAEYYRYFYREEVVVRITTGQVKGYKIASGYNYEYYNFIGIPYAKPPVGELRFKVCIFVLSRCDFTIFFGTFFLLFPLIFIFSNFLLGATAI